MYTFGVIQHRFIMISAQRFYAFQALVPDISAHKNNAEWLVNTAGKSFTAVVCFHCENRFVFDVNS